MNPFNSWKDQSNGTAPSVYGALPYASDSSLTAIQFTSFNPNVLNCSVLGPQRQPVYYVITDPQMPRYTHLKSPEGRSKALVEWQDPPQVEVRGTLSKRRVKEWLSLTPDQSARNMDVNGARYVWRPEGSFINLYTNSTAPQFLSRVSRGRGSLTVEISGDAMRLGLLEVVIVATVLLQCGKHID